MVLAAAVWSIAWIGAVLLVLAGVAKVRHPEASTESLALAGLPDRPGVARLLGVGEVVVGVAVVVSADPLAVAALALAYTAFTVVSWWMLRTDQGSCGCFGEVDAPLTRVHVVANAVIAVGATAAALVAAPLPTSSTPLGLLAGTVTIGAVVVRMLLTLVPAVADGVRRLSTS